MGLGLVLVGALVVGVHAHRWIDRLDAGTVATPDSSAYVEGAVRLVRGLGYTTGRLPADVVAESMPQTRFPPGYPLMLASAIAGGSTPAEAAARVAHGAAVLFAIGLYLLLVAAAGTAWSAPLAALAVEMALRTTDFMRVVDAVWSDLPSAAVVAWMTLATVLFARAPRPSARAGACLGLALAAAGLVRWANLFLTGGLLLSMSVGLLARGGRERLRALGGVAAGLFIPTAAWVLRNRLVGGAGFGDRAMLPDSPFDQAFIALRGLVPVLVPVGLRVEPDRVPWRLVVAFAALVLLAVSGLLRRRPTSRGSDVPRLLLPAALLFVAGVATTAAISPLDPLDRGRFWLPLIPLLYGATFGAVFSRGGGVSVVVGRAALLGVALACVGSVQREQTDPTTPRSRPSDWWADEWTRSGFVAAIDGLPRCHMVSNEPRFVLLHAPTRAVRALPAAAKPIDELVRGTDDLCIVELRRRLPRRAAEQRDSTRKALRALVRDGLLQAVFERPQGAVYRRATPVKSKQGTDRGKVKKRGGARRGRSR